MWQRAKAQELEADFDGAIQTYKDILAQHGEREQVRKALDDLIKKWEFKSPEHREARKFVYGPWARLKTLDDVRTGLPKAKEALETCKQVGDKLTPIKLLNAAASATEILEKEFEELKKSESEFDKINLQQVQKLIEDLQALIKVSDDRLLVGLAVTTGMSSGHLR